MYEAGLRLPKGNPRNLPCCGVTAVAVAAEVPFQNAWDLIQTQYRKGSWRGRTWWDTDLKWALEKLHVQYTETKFEFVMNLREFCHMSQLKNPNKVYMVEIRGHFMVSRGNQVIDQGGPVDVEASAYRRCLVKSVREIISNNPEKAVDVKPEISYTNPANTNRSKQMSKIDQAKALYAANSTLVRKDMIALFVKELGLTPAAASTYQNTAKKAFEAGTAPAAEVKEVKTVKVETKSEQVRDAAPVSGGSKLHSFTREEMNEVLDLATRAEVAKIESMTQDARSSHMAVNGQKN